MTPAFWHGRRVLITGHTGFKGSWLTVLLNDFGSRVSGYALAPEARSAYSLAGTDRLVAESTIDDVRDLDGLRRAINRCEPEIVFHMAAQPLVRLSYRDPVGTYATNVMGTVNLLEACRGRPSIKAVVVVTSDKCYENKEWAWGYREPEAMGGHDPYSNSKGCAELVTSAYRSSFFQQMGTRVATGRAGNVIGGGDYSLDRLVPDLVRAIASGTVVKIRNPAAIRPWQHVLEPLSGYVRLAECLAEPTGADFADGWNFGPETTSDRTVHDVIESLHRHWGAGAWEHDAVPHVHEAHYLKLDSSKAHSRLGWRPRWTFEETIEKTVAWYQGEVDRQDMLDLTRRQIADYLSASRAANAGARGTAPGETSPTTVEART